MKSTVLISKIEEEKYKRKPESKHLRFKGCFISSYVAKGVDNYVSIGLIYEWKNYSVFVSYYNEYGKNAEMEEMYKNMVRENINTLYHILNKYPKDTTVIVKIDEYEKTIEIFIEDKNGKHVRIGENNEGV